MATGLFPSSRLVSSPATSLQTRRSLPDVSSRSSSFSSSPALLSRFRPLRSSTALFQSARWSSDGFSVSCCLPLTPKSDVPPSTKLYVSGLSFRTTEESLRNAFQNFGNLLEVNLVMDRIANRPRGFAFLRYATEGESKKAIEGMHGKFLDGRVIFVEVAKPRSEVRQASRQTPRRY